MSEVTGFQSNRTIALSMIIGAGGLTVQGIMPIVLGALLAAGRIDAAGLGWAATAELLGMALGLLLGAQWLGPSRTRWIVVVAGAAMAAANLVTLRASGAPQIVMARGAAGFAEGILVAVAALSIAFSAVPARLGGILMAVSIPPPLALSYWLPSVLMPRFGPYVGFVALAMIGAVCAGAALLIRDDFARKVSEGPRRIRLAVPTLLAVSAVMVSAAGFGAAWAYVDPLGASHGLTPTQIGSAVTATIIGQFLISIFVAAVGWRMPMVPTLVGMAALQVGLALLLPRTGTALSFIMVLACFGLLFQGAVPFASSWLVALDESRALAPLFFPLQLVGLAGGPFIASFVAGTNLTAVMTLAAAFYVVTIALYISVGALAARARTRLPNSVAVGPVELPARGVD